MDSKQPHPVNLKQYRKVSGKWQFVPVARHAKENPDPRLVLLNGEPVSSKRGIFYLDFSENGKRNHQPAGTVPREALEALRCDWLAALGVIIECVPLVLLREPGTGMPEFKDRSQPRQSQAPGIG